MNHTIEADKLDIRYFAESYESLMQMERSGSTSHIGSHSPRNVFIAYLRLSEKLGVRLMNEHFIARIEKLINEHEERRMAVILRVFGGKKETV